MSIFRVIMAVLLDKRAKASETLGACILRGYKRAPLFKSSVAVKFEVNACGEGST